MFPGREMLFNISLQIIKMACSWNNQNKNRRLKLYVKEGVLSLQGSSVPWRLGPAVSIRHYWPSCHQRKGPWEWIPSAGKGSGKPMIIWLRIRQLKPRLSTRRKLKCKGTLSFTSRATGWEGSFPDVPSSATASVFISDKKGVHLGTNDWSVPREMPPGAKTSDTDLRIFYILYSKQKMGSMCKALNLKKKKI